MEIRDTREFQESVELEKDYLIEVFTEKFEEYKSMITSRFSDFTDTVLDNELNIPQDEMVREILTEAKAEIISLRNQVNELTGENLELTENNRELYKDCVEMAEEISDHRNKIKIDVELTDSEQQDYFDIKKYFNN